MIVNGWDEIEITLQLDEQIAKYEEAQQFLNKIMKEKSPHF